MLRFTLTDMFRSNKPRAAGEESRARRSPAGRQNARRRGLYIEQLEVRRVLSAFAVINTDDSGTGSLRQALVDANANIGTDIIQFASGVAGTITLTSGELAITDSVDLQGPGAGVVTVSGNNASRVFFVSANATISGLKISGGSSDYGGGIYNSYGTLTVESSQLSGNSASNSGGGIINLGMLTMHSSTVSDNTAYQGGGIRNLGALTVQNSSVSGNSGSQYAGGIFNDGTLTLDTSILSGNSSNSGAGIYNWPGSTATMHNSTLSGNSGGGIVNRGTLTVDSSTLSDNSGYSGGGINNQGTLFVHNSTFSGNSATYGGGIYNSDGGTLTVDSSTLSGNLGSYQGGGIYTRGVSTLDNTIVAANFGPYAADDIDGAVASSSSHNLIGVATNLSGISHGSNGNQVGTALVPINPLLGALQNHGGPTATMALLPGSPAINAGDNSLIPAGVTTDQRGIGYARIENATVDIGAYEFVVDNDPFTFVVTNLDDHGTGSLRQAILNANANLGADIIQFAPGVTGTILLTSGELAITDDAVDIQGPGSGVITVSGNNASRVFRVTANATISGLTISGGSSRNGGGIYNAYGTLTVQNSTLSGNSADNGGGIYNAYGTLTVDTSILSGNSASQNGGGIFNANYGTFTVVQNSTLSGNAAANEGGGIFNYGKLTVDNSPVSDNSAHNGGGIRNFGMLTVVSSVLSGNSVPFAGGGIDNDGTVTVDSSTLSENTAYQGGGILNNGTLTVQNSTLSGNSGSQYAGGIFNAGTLTVESSTLSGNSSGSGGGINNWPGSTATVHNSTLSGNSYGGIINRGTLTVDSSTLSGNSGINGGGIDNQGTLTVHNSTFGGNGAEHGGGICNSDSGTLTVDSSTFSGNSDWGYGGGIYNRGTSTLNNTIVAANVSVDIDGTFASSSSHNLIGVATNLSGISHGSHGNLVGTAAAPINPMLGSLQNHGGPTATMALLPGSPALDAGDNSLIPVGVTTDQRGTGYARIENGTVDIGAYEFMVVTNPPSIFMVNTLADTVDADTAVTSLREAILGANAHLGADIIQFVAGLNGTIWLTSGEMAITDDFLDLRGPGAGVVTVSGNNASLVFRVTANATISGLTISGGHSSNGGGIYNAYGTLTVQNSTLSGNSADNGGGIYNAYGTLTVDTSIFSGNSVSGAGYYGLVITHEIGVFEMDLRSDDVGNY